MRKRQTRGAQAPPEKGPMRCNARASRGLAPARRELPALDSRGVAQRAARRQARNVARAPDASLSGPDLASEEPPGASISESESDADEPAMDAKATLSELATSLENVENMYNIVQTMLRQDHRGDSEDDESEESAAVSLLDSPLPAAAPVLHGRRRGQHAQEEGSPEVGAGERRQRPSGAGPSQGIQYEAFLARNFQRAGAAGPPRPRLGGQASRQHSAGAPGAGPPQPPGPSGRSLQMTRMKQRRQPAAQAESVDLATRVANARKMVGQAR